MILIGEIRLVNRLLKTLSEFCLGNRADDCGTNSLVLADRPAEKAFAEGRRPGKEYLLLHAIATVAGEVPV